MFGFILFLAGIDESGSGIGKPKKLQGNTLNEENTLVTLVTRDEIPSVKTLEEI